MQQHKIMAPGTPIKEQQNRIIEFFREYWGIQKINIKVEDSLLNIVRKDHTCHIIWINDYIDIDYQCNREISPQEWQKLLASFYYAINTPVPAYYVDKKHNSRRIFLRKQHRRGDGHIGCCIYPYKEEPDGGWDYNVESLFLYECDFRILESGVLALYPRNNGELNFDYTSWNEFTVTDCEEMIANWLKAAQKSKEYASFIHYVVEWIKPLLNEYESIMIEGNL